MKLLGQVLYGGNNAGGGAIDGIADDSVAVVSHGIQNAPARERGEGIDVSGSSVRMRLREDEEFGLQTSDLFETYLRPILQGVDDRNSTGVLEGIGDKRVFADGDERLPPNNE